MTAAGPLVAESELLVAVEALAREAGEEILGYYRSGIDVEQKDDYTPVTEADRAADAIIAKGLRALTPDIPVVTEEEVSDGLAPTRIGRKFWLVDPLDGTREFINDRDEFTVNIALIEDGAPVMGVVGLPARDVLYAADAPGGAVIREGDAQARPISARIADPEALAVVSSRSHANKDELQRYLADKKVADLLAAGSSLKFCRIADGTADLYPRFGPTMEWDTAAAHAILSAAGGHVRTLDGDELRYGKPSFRNPHFIASGRDA